MSKKIKFVKETHLNIEAVGFCACIDLDSIAALFPLQYETQKVAIEYIINKLHSDEIPAFTDGKMLDVEEITALNEGIVYLNEEKKRFNRYEVVPFV